MVATILEILKGILAALPLLDRWFTKPTEEKVEEGAAAIDAKLDKEQETGRPQ